MESLMEALVGRLPSNDKSLLPFSAPTYAQVRRAFSDWVRAVYRLEVVGADRLPVSGPAVVAPNHDSVLDGVVLGAGDLAGTAFCCEGGTLAVPTARMGARRARRDPD